VIVKTDQISEIDKRKEKKNLRITEHGEKTNMKQTSPFTQAIGKGRCVENGRGRISSRERKVASSATWERASAGHASVGRKACKAVKRGQGLKTP
jgi:hypothetical protein